MELMKASWEVSTSEMFIVREEGLSSEIPLAKTSCSPRFPGQEKCSDIEHLNQILGSIG